MARSLNKAQLIGHLGKDPETRTFSNGGSVVTFTVATSDQWKDRNTGERRERTEWHRVCIFSEPIGRVAQQYLKKGDQVYLEGRMETRKWKDQGGQERYTTEVVIRPYQGEMTLLGGRSRNRDDAPAPSPRHEHPHPQQGESGRQGSSGGDYGYGVGGHVQQYSGQGQDAGYKYPDDEIPF